MISTRGVLGTIYKQNGDYDFWADLFLTPIKRGITIRMQTMCKIIYFEFTDIFIYDNKIWN